MDDVTTSESAIARCIGHSADCIGPIRGKARFYAEPRLQIMAPMRIYILHLRTPMKIPQRVAAISEEAGRNAGSIEMDVVTLLDYE